MAKFVTIGERIHCISPVIRKAMEEMNPEPILEELAYGIKELDTDKYLVTAKKPNRKG